MWVYTGSMTVFHSKRIYDEPAAGDGYRVLVDRLWPRGVSKERAALDEWCKDIAPSTELRKWFGHDPVKFAEFSARYEEELTRNTQVVAILQAWQQHPVITLLYAAHDPQINQAIVLQDYLAERE